MIEVIPLFSGSAGNSVYFRCGEEEFLIDAGMSCRAMCTALRQIGSDPKRIRCVFVTHEHTDHIAGLEQLCKRYALPVYVNDLSAKAICSSEQYPYLSGCLRILEPGTPKTLYGMEVQAFRTPHDSCGSVGYRFDGMGDSFSYATDLGYVTRAVARNLFGTRTVMFESNHDLTMLKTGRYPASLKRRILSDRGHLSNDACAAFLPHLAQNGAKRIILGHLSKDNNTPALALETAVRALEQAGFHGVTVEVAPRSILT